MLRNLLLVLSLSLSLLFLALAQDSRHFTFHYAFTVKNLPSQQKVRIWIPAAHSDALQEVRIALRQGDLPLKKFDETKDANELYYAEVSSSTQPELHFDVEYDVQFVMSGSRFPRPPTYLCRFRSRPLNGGKTCSPTLSFQPPACPPNLPQRLRTARPLRSIKPAPFTTMFLRLYGMTRPALDGDTATYSTPATQRKATALTSIPWLSPWRALKNIPARFEIGFPLPPDKHEAEVAGYHCWSDFWIDGKGWIPVDISEAWKHPDKRDYFFGSHDGNRVQFTMGRDLHLNSPQAGKPLNYFVYPLRGSRRQGVSKRVAGVFVFRRSEHCLASRQ